LGLFSPLYFLFHLPPLCLIEALVIRIMKEDFELSPLARQKLEGIEEPSSEEKERLRETRWLESLLASYFTRGISTDELWLALKEKPTWILKGAQKRVLDSLSLEGGEDEFASSCKAMLAIETLKEGSNYPYLEHTLKELGRLRKSYGEGKEKAYEEMKRGAEDRVRSLARQALAKGMKVDVGTSVEANVKANPRWKGFISQHEREYSQRFELCIDKFTRTLQV